MRIKKPAKKRDAQTPVADLITRLESAQSDYDLAAILTPIKQWPWAKTDLVYWINVLNRFDGILEETCKAYGLSNGEIQLSEFTPKTKTIVLAILNFTRLLLAHATNKKTYASYDRINELYMTRDIDVLEANLRLASRPAQLYKRSDGTATERLLQLATSWNVREFGLNLVDLARDDAVIPPELHEVRFSYYRQAQYTPTGLVAGPSAASQPQSSAKPTTTPGPVSASNPAESEGMVSLNLGNVKSSNRDLTDIFADAVEAHKVPPHVRLLLLQKIRLAMAMSDPQARRRLLTLRLIALAVLVSVASDGSLQAKLFIYEPELIPQIAELVNVDRNVDQQVRTAALVALEALARIRHKTTEVMNAVNASIGHGIIISAIRKAVDDCASPQPVLSEEYLDVLFTFVNTLQNFGHIGALLVNAGLTPLLIDFVKHAQKNRLKVAVRAVTLIDTLASNFTNAASSFLASSGIPVFVESAKAMVESSVANESTLQQEALASEIATGWLPSSEGAFLRALLRSIVRVMATSGTSGDLRNLIDSSLPHTIKSVFEHPSLFGPQIYALAVNTMSTFIHNEPTSLAVIQEQGLPDAFYTSVEAEIAPSYDVLASIPQAIGALCLNDAGRDQFTARNVLPKIFATFLSEKHARILLERENASMFGANIDELVRHHPSTRDLVIRCIVDMLKNLLALGETYESPTAPDCTLLSTAAKASHSEDVSMSTAPAATQEVPLSPTTPTAPSVSKELEQKEEREKSNLVLIYIDVVGRFLEGFLQNHSHSKEFTKTEGLDIWCRLLTLPCIPITFLSLGAALSVSSLLKTVGEVSAMPVLTALVKALRTSMVDTRFFWDDEASQKALRLSPMLFCDSEGEVAKVNGQCRKLIGLQAIIGTLEVVFPHLAYSHSRGAITTAMQSLTNSPSTPDASALPSNTLELLGKLQRSCMRENVLLKLMLSEEGVSNKAVLTSTSNEAVVDDVTRGQLQLSPLLDTHPGAHSEFIASFQENTNKPTAVPSKHNWKIIKEVMSQFVHSLEGIFVGVIGKPPPRRAPDAVYRHEAVTVAETVAKALAGHLEPITAGNESLDVAYATVAIRSAIALIDREKWIATTRASLLYCFEKSGGLDKLLVLFQAFVDLASTSIESKETEDTASKLRMLQAFGGMRIALDLLQRFAACKVPDATVPTGRETNDADQVDLGAFVVKCRAKVVPAIAALWRSKTLRAAPPNAVRLVFRIIVEILVGESQEVSLSSRKAANGATSIFGLPRTGPGSRPIAAFVESRIQQFVDMGFPRQAAVVALQRSNNSIGAATEYLISNPDFVAEYANMPEEEEESAPAAEKAGETAMDVDASKDAASESTNLAAELKKHRDDLRACLFSDALSLIGTYEQLVFDLRESAAGLDRASVIDLEIHPNPNPPAVVDLSEVQLVTVLLDRIDALQNETDVALLASHLRLLALMTADISRQPAILELQQRISALCERLLVAAPKSEDNKHLAPLLLVTTNSIQASRTPKMTERKSGSEEEVPEYTKDQVLRGPALENLATLAFSTCKKLLQSDAKLGDDSLAALRLTVLLTKDYSTALQFVDSGQLAPILSAVMASSSDSAQELAMLLMRHCVEAPLIVQAIMEKDVTEYLGRQKGRVVEVPALLTALKHDAVRDGPLFLQVARRLCKFQEHEAAASGYTVVLKGDGEASVEAKVEDSVKASIRQVLLCLIGQIQEGYQKAIATPPSAPASKPGGAVTATAEASTSQAAPPEPVAPPESRSKSKSTQNSPEEEAALRKWAQVRFLLACLAELLFSYAACKTVFVDICKEQNSETSFMRLLLLDVAAASQLTPEATRAAVKTWRMSDWLNLVLQSLCAEIGPSGSSAPSTELDQVRSFVLEQVNEALLAVVSGSGPTAPRYAQLSCIAELCAHLLTPRTASPQLAGRHSKPSDELDEGMAKLLSQHSVASNLTAALAMVDLNYPHVRTLINRVLRPLQLLSRYAKRVGKSQPAALQIRADVNILEDSDADEDESLNDAMSPPVPPPNAREETPDIYRSSALGMFQGELETNESNQQADYMSVDDQDDIDAEDDLADIDADAQGITVPSDESDDDDDDMDEGGDDDLDDGDEDEDMDDDGSSAGSHTGSEVDLTIDPHLGNNMLDGDEVDIDVDDMDDPLGMPPMPPGIMGAFDALVDDMQEMQEMGHDHEHDDDGQDDEEGDGSDENSDDEQDEGPNMFAGEPEEGLDDDVFAAQDGPALPGNALAALQAELGLAEQRADAADPEVNFSGPEFANMIDLDMGGLSRARRLEGRTPRPAFLAGPGQAIRELPLHPLLVDTSSQQPLTEERPRQARHGGAFQQILQTIGEQLGENAFQLFEQVLGSVQALNNTAAQQFQLVTEDGQVAANINIPAHALTRGGGRRPHLHLHASGPVRHSTNAGEPSMGLNLVPASTPLRWEQEARALHGSQSLPEATQSLANYLTNALLPAALREARQKREEAATVPKSTTPPLPVSGDVDMVKTSESVETPEAPSTNIEAAAQAMEDVTMQDPLAEVLALARSLASEITIPPSVTGPTESPAVESGPTSADVPAAENAPPVENLAPSEGQPAEATPAQPAERVTITIHGRTVDITATGIDPTFLEALPDDMREEVLNQHIREVRDRTSVSRVAALPDTISREFLDALPPEIRAEVIQQEEAEVSRQERARTANAAGGNAGAEMDPASFLATLEHEPDLRREIIFQQLASGGQDFLDSLPPSLLSEVDDLRRRHRQSAARRSGPISGGRSLLTPRDFARLPTKEVQERDALQLLDKAGVATLIRLLFFPQQLEKGLLQSVLTNLCDHVSTRIDIVNSLLGILQDGTSDSEAVDRTFTQMSAKASKSAPKTPASTRKKADTLIAHIPGENAPNLVIQRCLEALGSLVMHNESIGYYFLAEQESLASLSRKANRKATGKGKEKERSGQAVLPLVVLLNMLERPSLLDTAGVMDILTTLMSAITRHLAVLSKPVEAAKVEVPPVPASAAETTESTVNTATEPMTDVVVAPAESSEPKETSKAEETPSLETQLKQNPPHIPPASLALVVNILDGNDVSSRTFKETLSLIHNLGNLDGARAIISEQLSKRAVIHGEALLPALALLEKALQSATRASDLAPDTISLFSSASSAQTKLLRVLKTIDYIHSKSQIPGKEGEANKDANAESEKLVNAIYLTFNFDGLWDALSACLDLIGAHADLAHIGTVLLPLIESFMVVSKYAAKPKEEEGGRPKIIRNSSYAPSSPVAGSAGDAAEARFLQFTRKHRALLNVMVRTNPSLMSGSFSILVLNPAVLEFENKRNYFNQQIHKRGARELYGTLAVNVRRQYVFEDSFQSLGPARRTPEQIKYGKLSVRFYDEEGVDAGGVTREWYSTLARSIFNPNYALFQPSSSDQLVYQPNPHSYVNTDHLPFFTFVGRIIGKSVFDGRLLEAYFTKAFYKHLLGLPVDLRDLESVDPDAYRSLMWTLENPIEGVLDLTFSVEADEWGVTKVVDLKPGGRDIAVTDANKREYVDLVVKHRLTDSISDQVQAFVSGFTSIIPKDLVAIFNASELQLLISGLPDIDVDEWRANSDLSGYSASSSPVVWFWRAVRSFSQEERAKLLQFVTGSSRVPLEGFAALQGVSGNTKFNIVAAHKTDVLPSAHSCFNQIDLPNFSSYEDLRRLLLMAITETEGFGFA